jgi:hypothetical protein
VLSQLQNDKNPHDSEVEFERKINNQEADQVLLVDEMITSPGIVEIPISYPSTSRLNPDNTFSRLREEMRISPCPPSPISNKRKLSSDDKVPEPLYYRPLKRIFKSPRLNAKNSPPTIYIHKRSNSVSSTTSDVSMCTPAGSATPENPSPRLAHGALPLGLGMAGQEFSNMKLS